MQKLLPCLAAAAVLALSAGAGQACDFHVNTTADVAPKQEVVAMSTADDAAAPVALTSGQNLQSAAASDCPAGAADCAPAKK